jgi:hypothetical protein
MTWLDGDQGIVVYSSCRSDPAEDRVTMGGRLVLAQQRLRRVTVSSLIWRLVIGVSVMVSGCSSDPKVSGPPPQPGPGQARTYVIYSSREATMNLAKIVRDVVGGFSPDAPLTNVSDKDVREGWDGEGTDQSLYAEYNDASINYLNISSDIGIMDYRLNKGPLDSLRARRAMEKLLTDVGSNVRDFKVGFRPGDGLEPASLDCTRMVEGTPVDYLLFPCGVKVGDDYKIIYFSLSARKISVGWPVDVLSAEEAAVVDGRGVDVKAAKGRPVRVLTGVRVDDDRQVMVPAWSVPVLAAAADDPTGSLGVTLLAVSPDDLKKLIKRLQ